MYIKNNRFLFLSVLEKMCTLAKSIQCNPKKQFRTAQQQRMAYTESFLKHMCTHQSTNFNGAYLSFCRQQKEIYMAFFP